MNNQEFLDVIKSSFLRFLNTHSRSNEKLKILHGRISHDLSNRLGSDYQIKSLGYGDEKEGKIQGRYINKDVDIAVLQDGNTIAGISVKFVMQNYKQNSNNYFENMLGETANIKMMGIPYFHILILFDKFPYYDDRQKIKTWESLSKEHLKKYEILSVQDKDNIYPPHEPNQILLYILTLPEIQDCANKTDYIKCQQLLLQSENNIKISEVLTICTTSKSKLIINDYETFIMEVVRQSKLRSPR